MEAIAEITAAVKNVPALRFPEFDGEWEDERLGNGVNLISGQHLGPNEYNTEQNGDPYFTGPSDFTNAELEVTKWTNNSKHFGKNGDVLITVKGSGVGTMTLLRLPKVAMGRQLMAIKSGKFNSEFIYHFLLTKKNLFVALASGNMIPGLSRQDIITLKLKVPTIAEQQKIASFLTIVDDKIQQLSKKKELLDKYKKGIMQQIFSQQIRFKDDNGNDFPEWEEKMIKDIAPLQRGFDLPVIDIKEGDYPVVFSNGILKSHSEYKAKGPGVVTGRSGTIGQVTYVEKDYWPHNTSLWVTNFCGNDPKYIFYFYQQFKLERFGTGSGVPTLNRNDVHVQKVYFPSYSEQVKMRDFFTVLDNKLNYTSKQLEQAQQFKKGLLQQMFV